MLAGHEPFFRAVTKKLAKAGILRLHTLTVDGRIAGVIYQAAHRDRACAYITGFDPMFERFSSGSLLLDYAMRRAIGEGARVWDFLRGREAYKSQWGAKEIRKRRLRLWHEPAHAPEEVTPAAALA